MTSIDRGGCLVADELVPASYCYAAAGEEILNSCVANSHRFTGKGPVVARMREVQINDQASCNSIQLFPAVCYGNSLPQCKAGGASRLEKMLDRNWSGGTPLIARIHGDLGGAGRGGVLDEGQPLGSNSGPSDDPAVRLGPAVAR